MARERPRHAGQRGRDDAAGAGLPSRVTALLDADEGPQHIRRFFR
jgi:hypothetical protein